MRPWTNSSTLASAAANWAGVSRLLASRRTRSSISSVACSAIDWASPKPSGPMILSVSCCAAETAQSWMAAAWLSAMSRAACAAGIARIFQ